MPQETGIVPQGPPEYWKYQTGSGVPGGSNPEQMSRIITGSIGPNSIFKQGELVYVPGLGMVNPEDFGPDVGRRQLDIASRSYAASRDPAVNRMVDINGNQIRLTGYPPAQYDPGNRDPTGGGNYVRGTSKEIVPWSGQAPGGWEDPLADIQAPYEGGPATSPQEFEPGPQAGPPATNEGMVPTGPNGENFATNENMMPTGPNEYLPSEMANIPTNEAMFPPPEFYPSEGFNIPTFEDMQPVGPDEYRSDTGANVATNESMMPTDQPEYLPSEGVNLPTDEGMYPAEPNLYQDSTAGANIPTDEFMQPTDPGEYRPADEGVGAAPAEQTFYYPSGDGTYTELDSSGNPVPTTPGPQPGLANIPGVTFNAPGTGPSDTGNGPLYYDPVSKTWVQRAAGAVTGIPGSIGNAARGIAGSVGNAARGIAGGIRSAIETPGYSSPEYLRSIGYEPGQGTDSLWPGAPTGPTDNPNSIQSSAGLGGAGVGGEGGSFYGGLYAPHGVGGALPGSFTGLGQGGGGEIFKNWFGRMSRNRMIRGGDPTLGFARLSATNVRPGQAIARFSAHRGQGSGVGGRGIGYGIRGGGPTRYASAFRNPAFFAGGGVPAEASSQNVSSGGRTLPGPGGIA